MARCEMRVTDHVGTNPPESRGWRDILSLAKEKGEACRHVMLPFGFHRVSRHLRLYGPPSRLWAEQVRRCSFIRTILRIIRVNGSFVQQQAPRIVCGVDGLVGESHHAMTVVSCDSWAPAEIKSSTNWSIGTWSSSPGVDDISYASPTPRR